MKTTANPGSTGSTYEEIFRATFGHHSSPAAVSIFLLWKLLLHREAQGRQTGNQAQIELPRNLRQTLTRAFIEELHKAIATGNAQFFREISDVIETAGRTNAEDPLRSWLLVSQVLPKKAPLEAEQLKKFYQRASGNQVDIRVFRRVCAELGIALAPAKPGPKSRTK